MRVFAISDLHVDYQANARWVARLSAHEYTQDVLILAGDVSSDLDKFKWCLDVLQGRFLQVLFTPGNHDLWVALDRRPWDSFQKFETLRGLVQNHGASMSPYSAGELTIVPLLSWYDYSFGAPDEELHREWMDFVACRWPVGWNAMEVTDRFLKMNKYTRRRADEVIISFSHFLPRVDLMPPFVQWSTRRLYPVLGTHRLDAEIRKLDAALHVYGHSHLNRRVTLGRTTYVNNAFGYPYETRIAAKRLAIVYPAH
jgi:predicted phosphodiesterase